MNNTLVAFLYLLMRDTVPTGKVVRIIKKLEKEKGPYDFTSKHLAAYAEELAERLTK